MAELPEEEGSPADEADVDSKQDSLQSAIWRLTAGNGRAPPVRGSSGTDPGALQETRTQQLPERRTAAGRLDFVLQVPLKIDHPLP